MFTLHQVPCLTFSRVTVVMGLSSKTVFTGLLGLSEVDILTGTIHCVLSPVKNELCHVITCLQGFQPVVSSTT